MASGYHGTLYIGVTSHIQKREQQHRLGLLEGFTKKYGCKRLVYVESVSTMEAAIVREKALKRYKRSWKIELIEAGNPHWHPLDPVTLVPTPEEQLAKNYRGGWVDDDGNVVRDFNMDPPIKSADDGV